MLSQAMIRSQRGLQECLNNEKAECGDAGGEIEILWRTKGNTQISEEALDCSCNEVINCDDCDVILFVSGSLANHFDPVPGFLTSVRSVTFAYECTHTSF